ncbi:hypothetical protein LTR85_008684 [Meristemomyces frigidus]|nr:hypothetical protein LTR85_008684 [Meristemomyces frigidus]
MPDEWEERLNDVLPTLIPLLTLSVTPGWYIFTQHVNKIPEGHPCRRTATEAASVFVGVASICSFLDVGVRAFAKLRESSKGSAEDVEYAILLIPTVWLIFRSEPGYRSGLGAPGSTERWYYIWIAWTLTLAGWIYGRILEGIMCSEAFAWQYFALQAVGYLGFLATYRINLLALLEVCPGNEDDEVAEARWEMVLVYTYITLLAILRYGWGHIGHIVRGFVGVFRAPCRADKSIWSMVNNARSGCHG